MHLILNEISILYAVSLKSKLLKVDTLDSGTKFMCYMYLLHWCLLWRIPLWYFPFLNSAILIFAATVVLKYNISVLKMFI